MDQLPSLISDLALILITAALTTLLFKKIKQPLVLGYIIAGILVGPHLKLTPTVADTENIQTLADIGVIFLLFCLGLEFSFRKLQRVGNFSAVTAIIEIACTFTAGFFLGKAMGWKEMDSLFLGGMLSSSSTSIILKSFEDLGLKVKNYTKVVFGVLVIEDIVVIVLMVLLSTLAVTKHIEGMELAFTIAKLSFFLILWFIVGIFFIPTFLKKTSKLLDDETLLILSIGLCLLMVVLATSAGFSAELGAFVMGSIIAETTSALKIRNLIKPVKNLFGAIFFVSIGMLMDPKVIIDNVWPVILISLLLIVGKMSFVTIGAIISGQSPKQSIQIGLSMAQIGEFSFIVATLGMSLNVTSDFLFPIAVGVSAITTFTTPFMMRYSEKISDKIIKLLPKSWIHIINRYSASTLRIQVESEWKKFLKMYLKIILINGLIIIAILLLSFSFFIPFVNKNIGNSLMANIISFSVTLLAISPFLWALMAKRPVRNETLQKKWIEEKQAKLPLILFSIGRILTGMIIIQFIFERIFPSGIAILIIIPVTILVIFLSSKHISHNYYLIEQRFVNNLNERDNLENNNIKTELKTIATDIHIADFEVPVYSSFIGKRLIDLAWREKFGINIAYIERGGKATGTPGKDTCLYPYDKIGIIGTDSQIENFKSIFQERQKNESNLQTDDIITHNIVIGENNDFQGKIIRQTPIYQKIKGIVIRINRHGTIFTNPSSDFVLEKGDILWIVGERKFLKNL